MSLPHPELEPVYRRLDEHSAKIIMVESRLETEIYRIGSLEKRFDQTCKIMVETRQEVITRIAELSATLSTIQVELAVLMGKLSVEREHRAERKDDRKASHAFIMQLPNLLIAISVIIGAIIFYKSNIPG